MSHPRTRDARRPKGRGAAHTPLGRRRRTRRPSVEPLEGRALLAAGAGSATPLGLAPAQLGHAYGFDNVYFQQGTSGDGAGQTIAIVDPYSDPRIGSDLARFDQQFGLAAADLTVLTPSVASDPTDTLQPAPPPDASGSSWGAETALDVEWAHALAPAAAIDLIEVPGGTTNQIEANLIAGVAYARNLPGVSVISMSWVVHQPVSDALFTTPAGHQGITFVAGAGDTGSPSDFPAESPNVLSVGGTFFSSPVDAAGDYGAESAWASGGGGVDPLEKQPGYQSTAKIGPTGGRAVPDVAFDAGSSVAVCDSYDEGTAAPWIPLGGTSLGAPAWSALVAIADQGRMLAGRGTLDGASEALPGLYSAYGRDGYSVAFHDVTAGGNNVDRAGAGYDLTTGLGTPNAPGIAAMLGGDIEAPDPIAPGSGTGVSNAQASFSWTSVPGADGYELTVTDATTGASAFSGGVPGTTASCDLTAGHRYSWTVAAVAPDGKASSAASPPVAFAVVGTPVPTGPSGILATTAPPFRWQAVPGASGYELQVFDAAKPGSPAILGAKGIASTSYTFGSTLADSTTYDWTVTAQVDGPGGATFEGTPSQPAYFTVDTHSGVVLLAPPDGAVNDGETLQWAPVPNAKLYHVTLHMWGLTDPQDTYNFTTTDTTYTPDVPGPGTLGVVAYYWTVSADVDNNGSQATVGGDSMRSFVINYLPSGAPPDPSLPAPGSVVNTATPYLLWLPRSELPNFSLSIFDVTAGTTILSGLGSFQPTYTSAVPLPSGHTYEWSASGSTPARFTVSVPGAGGETLAAPVLNPVSASGLVASSSVSFSWQPVDGATSYGFRLLENGSDVIPPALVQGTSYTPDLSSDIFDDPQDFTWVVTAYDANDDYSPPSAPSSFVASVPSTPGLAAPTGLSPGGTVTLASPTFRWSLVPGATGYSWLLVDQATGLPVATGSATTNSLTYDLTTMPALLDGHSYRWYVCPEVYSSSTGTTYGRVATQAFTDSEPLGAPVPSSPAPLSIASSTTPVFRWSAVSGATGYVLSVHSEVGGVDGITTTVEGGNTTSFSPTSPLTDGVEYEWQVGASFSGGLDGPLSPMIPFDLESPGVPTPEPTGTDGVVPTVAPTLQWSPLPGASAYVLYLDDLTTGQASTPLRLITASYTIGTSLIDGHKYQWSVQAIDGAGDLGPMSTTVDFSVSVPQDPASTPEPTGPIGKIKTATPTLQWTSVPGAKGYKVTITGPNGQPAGGSPVTVKAPTGSPSGGSFTYTLQSQFTESGTYSYYVQAILDNDRLGPMSVTDTFTVSLAADFSGSPTPIGPTGLAPSAQPVLQWQPQAGAASYEVEIQDITGRTIANVLAPTLVVGGTSFPLGRALTYGRQYQWLVVGFDASGDQGQWSDPVPFQVPLPAPAPTGPIGAVPASPTTFAWQPVAGASGYQVEVLDVTGGGSTVVVGPLNAGGPSIAPGFVPAVGRAYQWQVRAFDPSGADGPWSAPTSFDVPASPPSAPAAPTPLGPDPGPSGFSWTAVAGAAGYRFELIDLTAGTTVIGPLDVPGTSFGPVPALAPGHTFRWQVLAYDAAGDPGAWSAPEVFSTESPQTGPAVAPPEALGVTDVVRLKHRKIQAFSLAFDEAIQPGSAPFYRVSLEKRRHGKLVAGRPLGIASVGLDAPDRVTIRLARPAKGPLLLTVLPGILPVGGAQGGASASFTVD